MKSPQNKMLCMVKVGLLAGLFVTLTGLPAGARPDLETRSGSRIAKTELET